MSFLKKLFGSKENVIMHSDKVHGDKVIGDSIIVGDISNASEVAIGVGASATVTEISSPELLTTYIAAKKQIAERPLDPNVEKKN